MIGNRPKTDKFLDRVAEENGVAIAVLDEYSNEVATSNNNSMCAALYRSKDFSADCARFCGRAFAEASAAGEAVEYVCHAGLSCKALPVRDAGRRYVAIIGRTFMKAENYRKATEKAISGAWRRFAPTEFFDNVLMSGSHGGIEKAIERLERFAVKGSFAAQAADDDILNISSTPNNRPGSESANISASVETVGEAGQIVSSKPNLPDEPEEQSDQPSGSELSAWRSLFGSLMNSDYSAACSSILQFIEARYGFDSQIWLERRENKLIQAAAVGGLRGRNIRIGIPADDSRMTNAARLEIPLRLVERLPDDSVQSRRTIYLFPVRVGADIRSGLAVETNSMNASRMSEMARFAHAVGPQLEILRLRDEVSRHDWISNAVKRFNEGLGRVDAEDFWMHLTQITAELLGAERASLLVNDEKSRNLEVRAAIGSAVDLGKMNNIGSRISKKALDKGAPIIATDFRHIGMSASPPEWRYRTSSFISFPIIIGERKLAVMNFTDRVGKNEFDERDLDLLRTIASQIAVAIDHAALRDRAGVLQQLSLTDSLTGLLNRRYLEERLSEEISRARRQRSPMSLLMIDVDHFKSYNDSFGHTAGDTALKLVANALRETLRGADVAARYGGEEFSILLPQTSEEESAAIAERIRQRVERVEFPKRRVTISIGIAKFSDEFDEPTDWIAAADSALYEAKSLGRNNVRVYDGADKSMLHKVH